MAICNKSPVYNLKGAKINLGSVLCASALVIFSKSPVFADPLIPNSETEQVTVFECLPPVVLFAFRKKKEDQLLDWNKFGTLKPNSKMRAIFQIRSNLTATKATLFLQAVGSEPQIRYGLYGLKNVSFDHDWSSQEIEAPRASLSSSNERFQVFRLEETVGSPVFSFYRTILQKGALVFADPDVSIIVSPDRGFLSACFKQADYAARKGLPEPSVFQLESTQPRSEIARYVNSLLLSIQEQVSQGHKAAADCAEVLENL